MASDDSGDLHDLFGGSPPPQQKKKGPVPPKPGKGPEPAELAADGWPAWMGAADPALAPAPPPKPKPAASPPKQQSAPQAAAKSQAVKPVPPPKLSLPAPSPERPATRRWLRTLACAIVIALAFVAGELAARYRPDTAIRFQHAVSDAGDHLPASVPPARWLAIAAGSAILFFGILVWQAGRPRRPLFLPFAALLCVASAGIGLFRGGHDLDLERNTALFKGRIGSLESELGTMRAKLADWQTVTRSLEEMKRQLQEQTARAQQAQADRDKLHQSSIVHQATLKEREETVSALKKEIEELRKKLAEKN